jgi:pimeloyl-ACP methyl ester carboxylesterase
LTLKRPKDLSSLLIGAQLAAVAWAILLVPIALMLFVVASTWAGRLCASWTLLTGLFPWTLLRAAPGPRTVKLAWGAVLLGLALGLVILVRVPAGANTPGARATHQYPEGAPGFARYSLGNLLPEEDQLRLGFTLMPMVDPLLTLSQAATLKAAAAPIYRELESDPDFAALGSVMSEAYRELLGQPFASGHSYVYIPVGLDRKRPAPVLVFFHGSGGNFKAYLWILAQVADRTGSIVVTPSNGLGNWRADDSVAGFDRAIATAARLATIDRRRITVAGLSNGGLAVSQVGAVRGAECASLIFLSPVFDQSAIQSDAFAAHWRNRSVLVITGDRDDRVPLPYVERQVEVIKKGRTHVRLETIAPADHFLMFSHRVEVEALLTSWLGGSVSHNP